MSRQVSFALVEKSTKKAEFGEIVGEYSGYVYSLAYKILGNKEDARDASQETFYKVHKNLEHYDSDRPFKNWIGVIAVNASKDLYRKKKRYAGSAEELAPDLVSDRGEVAQGIENQLFAEELLKTLGYDFRVVLVLFYMEGKSIAEISKFLDISEALVKVRLHRAKKLVFSGFSEN